MLGEWSQEGGSHDLMFVQFGLLSIEHRCSLI